MDRRSAGNPHRTRKLEDTQDKIGRLPTFCSNFSRLMLNAFTRFSNSSSSMLASVMVVKRTQFQQLWMFCFHITHVSFFGNWISKFFGNPISKKMNSNFFNYLYNQILLSAKSPMKKVGLFRCIENYGERASVHEPLVPFLERTILGSYTKSTWAGNIVDKILTPGF